MICNFILGFLLPVPEAGDFVELILLHILIFWFHIGN